LVRQILTFSRQTGLEQKVLQLGPLVKETVKLLRASIPATIHMQVHAKGNPHFVLADPTQMQQVLMNLCANAAHAMGETGGTLAIDLGIVNFSSPKDAPDRTLNPGRYVTLSVSDTGAGMTAEVAGRIFDPFFTTKKPAEGTGLGLPVAHGIVAKHGGAITVWSEPGRGSIFTVYLPEYRGEEERSSRERDTLIPRGHERVLVIEDEEPLAHMMDEMLTRLGYTVTCRTRSREALALIRHDPHQFDLVITDQTMPGMTGLELAKELHATRPDLPVILCTGFSNQIDASSAQRAGISTSVTKPLTRAELAKTVREALNTRPLSSHKR
jgi:CheY-like chemotaxis protein